MRLSGPEAPYRCLGPYETLKGLIEAQAPVRPSRATSLLLKIPMAFLRPPRTRIEEKSLKDYLNNRIIDYLKTYLKEDLKHCLIKPLQGPIRPYKAL